MKWKTYQNLENEKHRTKPITCQISQMFNVRYLHSHSQYFRGPNTYCLRENSYIEVNFKLNLFPSFCVPLAFLSNVCTCQKVKFVISMNTRGTENNSNTIIFPSLIKIHGDTLRVIIIDDLKCVFRSNNLFS